MTWPATCHLVCLAWLQHQTTAPLKVMPPQFGITEDPNTISLPILEEFLIPGFHLETTSGRLEANLLPKQKEKYLTVLYVSH